MEQIVNYKPKQERLEEFAYVELYTEREVLLGLPICVVEFGKDYVNPVLYGTTSGVPTAFEDFEVQKKLKELKMFNLKNNKGSLTETDKDKADISIRLPKDTNVKELVYDNGQVFLAKDVAKEKDDNDGND